MKKPREQKRNITEVQFLQIYVPIIMVIVGVALVLVERFVVSGNLQGLSLNLGTGILSSMITYVLLTRLLGSREKREEEAHKAAEYKRAIIQQMGSQVNDAALEAVRIARIEGWLCDGSLRGAVLEEANLKGAQLWGADLQYAILPRTDLQRADLSTANMQGQYCPETIAAQQEERTITKAKREVQTIQQPGYAGDRHLAVA